MLGSQVLLRGSRKEALRRSQREVLRRELSAAQFVVRTVAERPAVEQRLAGTSAAP
jgi:hypothetical protein